MNTTYKYLFKIGNPYNNKDPFYKLRTLPKCNVVNAYIFAGKKGGPQFEEISLNYLYLELSNELTDENRYSNLQRYLNLLALESGFVSNVEKIQVAQCDNFEDIYLKYKSSNYYWPGVHKSGIKPDCILRVQKLIELTLKLTPKNFEKFDNSLNTYIWALEIRQLPNPHLKFTLYMTLLLSSMEQLCNNPNNCESHEICIKCGKDLFHHKNGEGQRYMLEQLVRSLLTGSGVNDAVSRIQKLYHKLRSKFLHEGKLYGDEKIGGFLADISRDKELLEDEVNIVVMNKKLLEQFCQKGENLS